MKISDERINSLKVLLNDIGLKLTNEQLQDTGLAIMRFVITKSNRQQFITKEKYNEKFNNCDE